MAVEVDHVVGLAFPVGLAERFSELLKRGRSQDIEVIGLTVGLSDGPPKHEIWLTVLCVAMKYSESQHTEDRN